MPERKHKPIFTPADVDWARLAAFIDGEGCIMVGYNETKKARSADYVRIIIANIDPRLMVWLRNNFGGYILKVRRRDQKPHWRICMKWYVTCKSAIEILRGCYPYLICKKDQAELAFAFQETVGRPGVKGHPPEVFERRTELKQQMQSLRSKQFTQEELQVIADEANAVN